MRINKYIALHTSESRRSADLLVDQGMVRVNGVVASSGYDVTDTDRVTINDKTIKAAVKLQTILLNKPVSYIVSRDGQGGKTIYDILPPELHMLNAIGRLDKLSSGLLLLSNDGALAEQLSHPRYGKQKTYQVLLDKDLQPLHHQMIADYGVTLEDGPSKLILERMEDGDSRRWIVKMSEGRNRQIRRTFESLGYKVTRLHRTNFGPYALSGDLKFGEWRSLTPKS
jgi:23S rRNA pseudouridine2605 synthase